MNLSELGTSGFKDGLYYGPGVPLIDFGLLGNLDSNPILVVYGLGFLK